MRERPNPVGSGRFRDHAQDSYGVLGMSCSSSLALSEEGRVTHTHGGICWGGSRASCSAEAATGNKLEEHPSRQENPLPCSSCTPLCSWWRNGCPQVASTAPERETHFCPGLAVEPVSHRRKDRNSCDFSFRFHECWSSGAAASDGSNSVSIFGAGWTRTKYSRPISSCRICSGNVSASRAYCERCSAIAAIFCWT